jgi:REP element-mobilizing transposase RayT
MVLKRHTTPRLTVRKRSGKMHLFKSREPNLVHYVTAVTYDRVPVFRSENACSLMIEALATTRTKDPFKLIGYVIMPDHFHMLANPLGLDISVVAGRLKGRSASLILKWLRAEGPRPIASKASAASSARVRSDSCCLVERVLGDRHLESSVHSSETPLHTYESGASWIVRPSGEVALVKLSRLFSA